VLTCTFCPNGLTADTKPEHVLRARRTKNHAARGLLRIPRELAVGGL